MQLLITGSRQLGPEQTEALLEKALQLLERYGHAAPTLLLHGGADGADEYSERWARKKGLPTLVIRPDYSRHAAKTAPLLRNTALVARADVTAALYAAGRRRQGGTWDAAQKTIAAGKPLLELEAGSDWERYTPPQARLFLP